ncbi:LysR family transcriptional regulator [Mariprofundus erugo]|uniref:LysR family transcriptional regulator n=1 Tax=Mariprofundus erugo TaxID=2528639 RepID=A0A5R9GNY4_9PROT|nr:LysR family transcriptional regulator [Mariprofundus erugo]
MGVNVTLKQLRIFVAVARREHVSHAAAEMSLSQSAVSMALAALEEQLGATLFDRVGKRMVMNQQGNWLLPRAQYVLAQVEAIAGEFGSSGRKMCAIGASTTIADALFPSMSMHLYSVCPDLELYLETGNSSVIIDHLLARRIEIGLVEGVCQHPRILARPWFTDQLLIVAHPAHPLVLQSQETPLSVQQLSHSRWVMREEGSGTRAIFEHVFRTVLASFHIVATLKHVPSIKQLVASGDMLACLSALTVAGEIARGELKVVHMRDVQLERQFFLLQHRQAFYSEIHTELLQWIVQQRM